MYRKDVNMKMTAYTYMYIETKIKSADSDRNKKIPEKTNQHNNDKKTVALP